MRPSVAGQVGDVREADEGHEVVLAERREGDVAHHDHLVVADLEGDAQVLAGVGSRRPRRARRTCRRRAAASRRSPSRVRVLADGLEQLAHEPLRPAAGRPRLGLADVGVDRVEVAVALVDVEAVAHDEVRRGS